MKRIDQAITRLRDALKDATLERSSFGELHGPHPVVLGNRDEVDAFVKKSIELWLHSWITSPMREAVEILEQHREIVDASTELEKALFRDTELGQAVKRMHDALEAGKRYGV